MLCKIADLFTEVPEAGGLAPRCQDYLWNTNVPPDIIIREEHFRPDAWPRLIGDSYVYLESGTLFYYNLLAYDGLMLHASAVELNGNAYLFSGNCGAGKSTHTHLWQQVFGEKARVFNDDKPALRRLDGRWYAYGTPWCGKNGINLNIKVPLAGICFLKQSNDNAIRQLSPQEAIARIIPQTPHRFSNTNYLDLLLSLVDNLIQNIPVFELENRPEEAAAHLSYETMRQTAREMKP